MKQNKIRKSEPTIREDPKRFYYLKQLSGTKLKEKLDFCLYVINRHKAWGRPIDREILKYWEEELERIESERSIRKKLKEEENQ